MSVSLRTGRPDDAEACGAICYEAFRSLNASHNFPPPPSREVYTAVVSDQLAHPAFYSVVAELEGRVVGSNFLDERSVIVGVGPITVDPALQNQSVGRVLMEHCLERAASRRVCGVRLVQAAFNSCSLSLYSKLGFAVREPLSVMRGAPMALAIYGYPVRMAGAEDIEACNQLCLKVHGHDRKGEVEDAVRQAMATVVERCGRVTGYATSLGFYGHAVGETTEDMKALIGASPTFTGAGILVPTRNGELFRWCLERGLRIVQPMTLMSMGLYNEPAGAYLPSILY